jgi:hypothetical protein
MTMIIASATSACRTRMKVNMRLLSGRRLRAI